MKYLFLILLFSSNQFDAFAQKKVDYEKVMNKLMKFYNNCDGDSLSATFHSPKVGLDVSKAWREIQYIHDSLWGEMEKYRYIGETEEEGRNVGYFEIQYSEKIEELGVVLDKNYKFYEFVSHDKMNCSGF